MKQHEEAEIEAISRAAYAGAADRQPEDDVRYLLWAISELRRERVKHGQTQYELGFEDGETAAQAEAYEAYLDELAGDDR